ncbi:hypothetical protein [Glycomyces tenuis]
MPRDRDGSFELAIVKKRQPLASIWKGLQCTTANRCL